MPFGDTPAFDRGIDREFMMPQGTLITSALSNKGNATGFGQDNTFRVLDQQEVRMFDNKGNLLFSGVGPEAAKQAVAIGQNLSDTLGRKADWTIQTGTQYTNFDGTVGTRWDDVAHEKTNKSALSVVGDVLGTALPIATSIFLPGIGPAIVAGAAGAGLRGDNVLKGAITGGLSAAGGQILGPVIQGAGVGAQAANAIGTGIGSTAGGLATGQSLKNSLIGGVTAGGLSYLGGEIFGPQGNNPSDVGIKNPGDLAYGTTQAATRGLEGTLADISRSTAAQLAGAGLNTTFVPSVGSVSAAPAIAPVTSSPLTVTGTRVSTPTSFNVSGIFPSARYSGDGPTSQPEDKTIEVEAQKTADAINSGFGVNVPLSTATVDSPDLTVTAAKPADTLKTETDNSFAVNVPTSFGSEIKVTAPKTADTMSGDDNLAVNIPTTTGSPTDGITVTAPKTADVTDTGTSVAPPFNLLDLTTPDVKKDLTSGDGKTDLDKALAYTKLAAYLLPLLGGGGGGAGAGSRIPGGLGGGLNPIFSAKLPSGSGVTNIPGGVGTAANFAPRQMGDQDWLTYGQRPEQSFFNYVPQPTGMAHGGSFAAKHGGTKTRTQFAVEGPGTGRSDEIPAVLSDGEYVMDAETVALLGDGSSKAGAKKLDDLRVKIRKHKGQKLAKGRFSADAKNPEAYLSGGRI